MNMGQYYSW